MEVKSYTFQSPYPSQFQIGREDTSAKQSDQSQKDTAALSQNTNSTLKSAETFSANQTKEVKPEVTSDRLMDVYA